MRNFKNNIFYMLKPFIPRRLQIYIRSRIVKRKRLLFQETWPIDKKSGKQPDKWTGWPDNKKFALILTHDVETEKGQNKCMSLVKLEQELGFISSFNFVPGRYDVSTSVRHDLVNNGFEVGVHDLYHDGKLYKSKKIFKKRAIVINKYLKSWNSVGFRSGSMHNNLDWMHDILMQYDSSTFDTDPFEPQNIGVETIFPFYVKNNSGGDGFVELPCTLSQDFTLFIIMKEKSIDIWKEKLDWIAERGGMALLNTHPDYMNFGDGELAIDEYPAKYYEDFLKYINSKYNGQFCNLLPKEVARLPSSKQTSLGKKIRVCMVAYTFYETDYRVMRYADALLEKGAQIDVIALRREGQPAYEMVNGINLYRVQYRLINEKSRHSYLKRLLTFFARAMFQVTSKDLKKPYDLVHVHNVPDFLVFSALLPKLRGARVILDIHDIVPEFYVDKFKTSKSSLLYKLLLVVERTSILFSNHTIISNDLWKKKLTSRSVKENKCTTILNYPDTNIFVRRLRRRKKEKIVILYPGTLNSHQGLDIAIEAFALITQEVPEAEFHIYGEGPTKEALIAQAEKAGLKEKVIFKGLHSIKKIAEIMSDADIGIVPKRASLGLGNEAFSTKTLEFMALGVPIIVSDTKIDKFYFDDSMVQFFKSEDVSDLAEKMLLLIKDKALSKRLKTNSSKYILSNNWEIKKNLYLDLVNSLMDEK